MHCHGLPAYDNVIYFELGVRFASSLTFEKIFCLVKATIKINLLALPCLLYGLKKILIWNENLAQNRAVVVLTVTEQQTDVCLDSKDFNEVYKNPWLT